VKLIPIVAARRIAEDYGYDQIIIYGRRIDGDKVKGGEHITTYGVSQAHCRVAAAMAETLKRFMGWGT